MPEGFSGCGKGSTIGRWPANFVSSRTTRWRCSCATGGSTGTSAALRRIQSISSSSRFSQATEARNAGWLRKLLRRAQPYLVNVRRNAFRELSQKPRVLALMEDLWLWDEEYHPKLGIVDTRNDSSQWII